MKKLKSFFVITLFAVATMLVGETVLIPTMDTGYNSAHAKGFRSSSRSLSMSWGRKSSSRKSFGFGWSKPKSKSKKVAYTKPKRKYKNAAYQKPGKRSVKQTAYHKPGAGKKAAAYQKPGSKSAVKSAAVKRTAPRGSARTAKQNRKRSAQALAKRQQKINRQRKSNPALASATKGKTYTAETIQSRRANYYGGRGSSYDPNRYRNSRMMRDDRDYGGFDNGFLTTMLYANLAGKDSGDAMFWYAMTGSPAMAMLMADAKQEAKDTGNHDLERRIASIEEENARLKARGAAQPTVGAALQQMGVPNEVAFSEEALTGLAKLETPKLRFATAEKDGNYYAFCESFAENASGAISVECIPTSGSMENLRLYSTGQVDGILAQSDTIDLFLRRNQKAELGPLQIVAYPEYVFMISNSRGGVKDVGDLEKSNTLYIGPKGSGTAAAWQGFVRQDERNYGKSKITTVNTEYSEALNAVANNEDAVMLYVGALDSKFIQGIERQYGDKLRLVVIDDSDFNDADDREGNPIYEFHDIPKGMYSGLQSGWIGSHDVETLTVSAVFALNERWVSMHGPEAEDAVKAALSFTIE